MPMLQSDILAHYEEEWSAKSERAEGLDDLAYSNPIQDAVAFPAYETLVTDLGLRAPLARVLDVGSGSGRWIRFLAERFRPAHLVGVDFARASVELLERWHGSPTTEFHIGDVTDPALNLHGPFDLINVANVLYHVPEPDKFDHALRNLARLAGPDGVVISTEFLPRASMRTEWMYVRSRYEFAEAVARAGLRICATRAIGFFSNEPMGIDGPDEALRHHFHAVRAKTKALLASRLDKATKDFLTSILIDVEQATLSFAQERIADVDLPGQKLVAMRAAT